MDNLRELLADRVAREKYENELHQLLRRGELAALEKVVFDGFKSNPSPFSEICSKITPDSIQLLGWDELIADIVTFEASDHPRFDKEERHVTAIGFDLVARKDQALDDNGEVYEIFEPVMQAFFYNDSAYDFSNKTIEEISTECLTEAYAWGGMLVGSSFVLEFLGFSNLIEAFEKAEQHYDGPTLYSPQDYPGKFLADWFIYLRIYQALQAQLKTIGLPRKMPVIFSQIDFASHIGVVFDCDRTASHEVRTNEILRERAQTFAALSKVKLERNIEQFHSNRDFVKSLPPRIFRNRIQKLTGKTITDGFSFAMKLNKIPLIKPLDKMSDKQFEHMISEYQKQWLSNH